MSRYITPAPPVEHPSLPRALRFEDILTDALILIPRKDETSDRIVRGLAEKLLPDTQPDTQVSDDEWTALVGGLQSLQNLWAQLGKGWLYVHAMEHWSSVMTAPTKPQPKPAVKAAE